MADLLGRGFFLALMAGAWLWYANRCADWRVDDELLARGKTTVAKHQKTEWVSQRGIPNKKTTYSYVVDGRYYEHQVTRPPWRADPEGQTITIITLTRRPGCARVAAARQRQPVSPLPPWKRGKPACGGSGKRWAPRVDPVNRESAALVEGSP